MMGLLMGMSLFSVMSLQWAKAELEKQQARNAERERQKAQDIAGALEFSILTETAATYSDDLELNRALAQSSATGKTRGGEDVLVVARDAGQNAFGNRNQRVAITASDDTLFRSQLYRTGSAEDLTRLKSSDNRTVVMFDSSAVRDRQIRTSIKNMELLAEHVYSFYAAHMRFPSGTEFDEIDAGLGLRDVWGNPFAYTHSSAEQARIEFTTHWNFTKTLNLSLKDGNNASQDEE